MHKWGERGLSIVQVANRQHGVSGYAGKVNEIMLR